MAFRLRYGYLLIFALQTRLIATKAQLCPAECKCVTKATILSEGAELKVLDCRNVGLRQLPENISLDTEVAILAGNKLLPKSLSGLRRLRNLTHLDATSNRVYSIEDWRLNQPSVKVLIVDGNEIEFLSNISITSIPHLRHLSLGHNRLEVLHSDAFRRMFYLRFLDLSYNRVFRLTPRLFMDLVALETLHLEHNNVHVLSADVFSRLTKLRKLGLAHNHLQHIHADAFGSLQGLFDLDLSYNELNEIPLLTSTDKRQLQRLNLNFNHLQHVNGVKLEGLDIEQLGLKGQLYLRSLDAGALKELPRLRVLDLSDNSLLQFIHRRALLHLPALQTLKLKNTNVTSLHLGRLGNLSYVHLTGSTLHCDCALAATQNIILNQNITVFGGICFSPPKLRGQKLTEAKLPAKCLPRIIPLFPPRAMALLGDRVTLDCRANGEPEPSITWKLPEHVDSAKRASLRHTTVAADVRTKHLNPHRLHQRTDAQEATTSRNTNNNVTSLTLWPGQTDPQRKHVSVTKDGTLIINYVTISDHGVYNCIGVSSSGHAHRSVTLLVKNLAVNVIILRITANAVTITWRRGHESRDYRLLYRASGAGRYHSVVLRPYMRTYTASELNPDTPYEFCSALHMHDMDVRLHCIRTRTQHTHFAHGIMSARSYVIGGAIGVLVVTLTFGCMVAAAVRRYNIRRRQEEEAFGDNLSQLFLAQMDSMSEISPITYENRAVEVFDDDDIDEIRANAASASASLTESTLAK